MDHAADRPLVLVADDDPDILELVEHALAHSGYDVITAMDGEAALRLCVERAPVLCVLDVTMPCLSGLEVTRRMRQAPALEHIPVILLTARAKDSDLERGLDAGADEYLRKPFSLKELRGRVQALLERG